MFSRPLCERRKFLHDNMVEVPNRILFSEMKHVTVRFCLGRISQEFFFFIIILAAHDDLCLCLSVYVRGQVTWLK